jgi:MOSC domain-containing protein YiiM
LGEEAKGSGEVLSLHLSRVEDGERVSNSEIYVDRSGVLGDKFYGKEDNRSILITAIDSYRMAQKEGIEIPYGSLGENIVVDYNPYHLMPGTRFWIGDVELEITQNCTLCKSLTRVDSRLPKLLRNDRGVFAKALRAGMIRTGDVLRLK